MNRRHFMSAIASATASAVAVNVARAQDSMPGMNMDTMRNANGTPMQMNQDAYLPVKLPPKPNAHPLLTDAQRDDLEHHIHCQCGCGLDVYTCRTTDFSCSVSPAMHADVMGLVIGGYDGREIIAAFQKVYGERVLMEPTKEGFNWLGYLLPFIVLATGIVVVMALLKRWSRPAPIAPIANNVDATPEELERLRAALRNDE